MSAPNRIDVHQHIVPPGYAEWLRTKGIADAGGRALPNWSAESALSMMDDIGTATGILSVSTPGTGPAADEGEAVRIAREVNDYSAELAKDRPDRFGFFATPPMPYLGQAVAEIARALDDLGADGVVLLANTNGTYLGQPGQDELFAELDRRAAVVFIHPAELPGPTVPGIAPFAADFLLDTTRAAYLLVRNEVRRRYPNIRFILSHAGGFVPYAAHRMAVGMVADTGRSPMDSLEDFAGFYFDTALSGSAAALPSLLAFAKPGHVLFGSDWPFAPPPAVQYFTAGLDDYPGITDHAAINRDNATALFSRLGTP
ncbi:MULTISPECIES: amidohydrolase family protein [unclassified Mycolicibacterium]|uniref:amidohydrolase family protein n=1 Tax=unclassified Mycolicibacterium TaxID=2636767 RepID=UPI001F4BF365|nr:amidohydrolase family protein [Mycolicibacterium sp. YH-1]UNB53930.1 amidohydrolase [Mycolicibacterium sp. YH-1]